MKASKTILVLLLIVAITGFSGYVFAHGGKGGRGYNNNNTTNNNSNNNMMGYGQRAFNGGNNNMGHGFLAPGSGLTDKQIDELNKAMSDFYNENKELRNAIYQKQLELRAEMAKKEPDTGKAKTTQSELSKLQADFNQKHLEHQLELRKLAPDYAPGFSQGHGYGGMGNMMGKFGGRNNR